MNGSPDDFMFKLTSQEFEILKSRFVTSSWGGICKYPYAFTEQGIAMLSSILKSKQAIAVNISIMRTFTKLRRLIATHEVLATKLYELEKKYESHDKQIRSIFEVLRQLIQPPEKPKRPIGFIVEEPKPIYRIRKKKIIL